MIQKPSYAELEQRVQEMAQAESKRRHTEDKLRISELWMRSIFNSLEEGVFVVSPDRKLTNVNKAAERIFGYSKGELANRSTEVLHIDHKHYVEFGRLINEAFNRNEVANFEFMAKRKSGEVFPTEHTVSRLKNDSGETLGIVSVIRDISERKQAEEALRESELKHKTLIHNIPGMVYRAYEDWSAEIISGSKKICGYTEEELNSKKEGCLSIVHPDDKEKVFEEGSVLAKSQQDVVQTYRIIAKDGNIRWVEDRKTSLFSKEGEFKRIEGVAFDITARTQIEEALRESEERLTFALKGSQLGFWDWNIKTGEVQRNERWAEMLGYSIKEIELTVKQWTDLIHIDDRAVAWKSIQDHLEGRTPEHELEYRMLCKDGKYKWILDRAMIVKRDQQGRPLRMSGTHLDITERKQAEEEREKLIKKIQEALKEIKTLRGILPLCSFCKKIRDDKGYWEKVDVYIHKHSQADISHSICPECVKEHYPDLDIHDK